MLPAYLECRLVFDKLWLPPASEDFPGGLMGLGLPYPCQQVGAVTAFAKLRVIDATILLQ